MAEKKKIKVLRIINRFNLGGPTFNAAYLTKYLSDDFETLLVGGDKDDTEESSTFILDQLGLNPIILPEMRRDIGMKEDKIAYQKLKQIIKEFQPDIVHTHASKEKRKSFREFYKIEADEIAIGIIGRLVPIKNHKLFIDAINILKTKAEKKIRVFIIGDGEEKENLIGYCENSNINFVEYTKQKKQALITFTSWIKDVDWANAGLDIVALSSLNEGTPVSLIEAQSSNKPIVTTNVGGVENIVIPNETAFVVPSNDLQQFSEALLRLINNDDLRINMGSKGWNHVKDKFHYTRLVNDMEKLYVSLLNNTK